MYMTDLDHGSTRFYTALIILAVSAVPAMPGVRALSHPAFLHRGEAFCALWTRLHLKAPTGPMLGRPGVQGMVVVLLIRKDRHETRKGVGRDVAKQERGRDPIIETGTGHEDSEQHPQRIDQQMALAPLDCLAAIIPARGASHLGGLDRLTLDAGG